MTCPHTVGRSDGLTRHAVQRVRRDVHLPANTHGRALVGVTGACSAKLFMHAPITAVSHPCTSLRVSAHGGRPGDSPILRGCMLALHPAAAAAYQASTCESWCNQWTVRQPRNLTHPAAFKALLSASALVLKNHNCSLACVCAVYAVRSR